MIYIVQRREHGAHVTTYRVKADTPEAAEIRALWAYGAKKLPLGVTETASLRAVASASH